jgi:hypothetical protein
LTTTRSTTFPEEKFMSYSTSLARPQVAYYGQPLLGTDNYRVKACIAPVLGTAAYLGHRIVRTLSKRRR